MAKLQVMCGRSMHLAVGALGRAFEQASGHRLDFDFATMGALEQKLDAGARPDAVVVSVPLIEKLGRTGALREGSLRDVARTYIGIAVKDGAPMPDVATPEAFERLVRGARAFAFSDPAVGGSAGVYLAKLFERMGLADAVAAKGLPQQSGVEVCKRVVEGKAEFGLTLSGEIASVEGVAIAGPLPPLGQDTLYCAAVTAATAEPEAAAAFIAVLTAPDTRDTWRKAGFDLPR